jgi:hypothetical protein
MTAATSNALRRIFLNYCREDASYPAAGLHCLLVRRLSAAEVDPTGRHAAAQPWIVGPHESRATAPDWRGTDGSAPDIGTR